MNIILNIIIHLILTFCYYELILLTNKKENKEDLFIYKIIFTCHIFLLALHIKELFNK